MADELTKGNQDTLIFDVISNAMKVPGVKVSRIDFLTDSFSSAEPDMLERIIRVGPVKAGYKRFQLRNLANGLVNRRSLESSGASFVAGLPGGLAMAGTIPADILQYYGFALRLVQEIGYLYGMEDLWSNGEVDTEKVMNSLVVYLGAMFGASGASATLKAMSSALAGQALKKLPQKALTKTFYYPIVKSIAKFFGQNMTKQIFAKGVSKAIPIIGGLASGGLTFATMRPMGRRLIDCLDEAQFDYTEKDLERDLEEMNRVIKEEEDAGNQDRTSEDKDTEASQCSESASNNAKSQPEFDYVQELKKLKDLYDAGIINDEEYAKMKDKIISRM